MKKKSDSSNSSVELEDSGLGLRIINPKLLNWKGSNKVSVAITATSYKEPPIVIEDFYKARKPRKSKIAPALRSDRIGLKVAPCIRAEHHNTSDVHFVASGQTTTTNTPAKSIEQGSETKRLSKVTSGISEQAKYLNMTYLLRDFPVNLFPLRENARVFKTKQGELFSTKYAELLEVKDQNTYSLRMLKDYFLTTKAEPSQLYSFHWMNLGMMLSGKCSTLSIGYPRTVKGSLSSVLEEKVDEKYYLSDKMLEYIEKKTHHEVAISDPKELLKSPIRGQGDKPMLGYRFEPTNPDKISMTIDKNYHKGCDGKRTIIRIGGLYDKDDETHQAGSIYDPDGISPILDTAQGGHREPLILADRSRTYADKGRNLESPKSITNALSGVQKDNLLIANAVTPDAYLARGERKRVDGKAVLTSMCERRIRRLTPKECERLQGFPDDWTKGVSDTQRYKAMGNAISIPVIEAIGRKILTIIK